MLNTKQHCTEMRLDNLIIKVKRCAYYVTLINYHVKTVYNIDVNWEFNRLHMAISNVALSGEVLSLQATCV